MIQIIAEVGLGLGLMVSLVLIIFSIKKGTANWLLGVSLFLLWYCLIISELYRTELIYTYAHFSRTGNIAAFLVTPFLYFFTERTFDQSKSPTKRYWWVFIPVLFYFIDFLPYFLLSLEEKRQIVRSQQLGDGHFVFKEGFFTPDWVQYYLRFLWLVLFLFLTVRVVWKNKFIIQSQKSKNNRTIAGFILVITSLYAISIIPGFFMNYFIESSYDLQIQSISVSITLIFTAVFLIFKPTYLYGFYIEKGTLGIEKKKDLKADYASEEINASDQSIGDALDKYVRKEKAYKNSAYSIHDLSKEIGIPVYKISPAINSCYGTNFNTWLNGHRIKEFEELILSGAHENQSLDQISSQCGFSNRTTFTNSCKKITGYTPSGYVKTMAS
ncbi:AraC family transcriptional regulator [Algoriphagus sp. SE2]|uniref:helix-turn-helix domain-containing protein n=1 Tax=Algoriphagus sp. SE2 TaxID=3141536 RepID=UPI0031CD86AD